MNDRPSDAGEEGLSAWERGIAEGLARDSASDADTEAALRSVMDRVATSTSPAQQNPAPPQAPEPKPAQQQDAAEANQIRKAVIRVVIEVLEGHFPPSYAAEKLRELFELLAEQRVDVDDITAAVREWLYARGGDLHPDGRYALAELVRLSSPEVHRLLEPVWGLTRLGQTPGVNTGHITVYGSANHSQHHGNFIR